MLLAIMDISARAISLADRPQRAIRVTSARTCREDRFSISSVNLSQTSAEELLSQSFIAFNIRRSGRQ
jgi:hypothetical protein